MSCFSYVPWNLHQRQPFQSDFSRNLDFVSFVKLAQDVGLLVILRPGPYTDAGWDFVRLFGCLGYVIVLIRVFDVLNISIR